MGFEAGVFQASPVVVAVAGVQGQAGRDVYAHARHRAEAQAAAAVAFLIGVFLRMSVRINRSCCVSIIRVGGKSTCYFFSRIDAVSDVSVGDAHTDIGFEFIVGSEIVNGGQAERRNGVECAVFLMFRLSVFYVKLASAARSAILPSFQLFYADGIFTVVPLSVTGIICGDAPAAEVVADRHPGVDGMRTDVSEIIAYRAYFVFACTGWFRIIVGNAFGGVG
ncbi:Uncharacterised protein [Neisseria gonorrhoeae]|nr:Uncharacterised protein [Neisseria gonorrhoeae]